MVFRQQRMKEAAEQYGSSVIDEANLYVNYEEDNFGAGAMSAIT